MFMDKDGYIEHRAKCEYINDVQLESVNAYT